jgi:hypothetical protein
MDNGRKVIFLMGLLVIGEIYSVPLSSTLPSFGKKRCAGKIMASSRQGLNEYPTSLSSFVSVDEVCLTGLTFSAGMGSDASPPAAPGEKLILPRVS